MPYSPDVSTTTSAAFASLGTLLTSAVVRAHAVIQRRFRTCSPVLQAALRSRRTLQQSAVLLLAAPLPLRTATARARRSTPILVLFYRLVRVYQQTNFSKTIL